jgi:hypothetical protein
MAGYFSVATFREVGAAATPQNLFSIENIDGANLVKIRRLIVMADETVALATVTPIYRISRATGVPTGGTTLNKAQFDTGNASNANTICRGSTASDGGANSGPTATAGDALWEQFVMRVHTAVGQILMPDSELLPYIVDTQDLILRVNQALLVQVVAPAGASNPATNHYIVACAWQEV